MLLLNNFRFTYEGEGSDVSVQSSETKNHEISVKTHKAEDKRNEEEYPCHRIQHSTST